MGEDAGGLRGPGRPGQQCRPGQVRRQGRAGRQCGVELRAHGPELQGARFAYSKYSSEGLEILAFPCNQFGGQEPGSDAEVLKFAERKGAKFPIMSKVDVNGAGAHPLFAWLKDSTSPGFPPMKDIPWNFGKF